MHTAKSNISNRGKKQNTEKKEKNRENKTTDKERTHNLDSFSAGKNTSSWILKCITRPQRLVDFIITLLRKETHHKAKTEKKTQKENNADILKSFLKFCSSYSREWFIWECGSLVSMVNTWKTNRQGRKRDPKQNGKKLNKKIQFLVLKKTPTS